MLDGQILDHPSLKRVGVVVGLLFLLTCRATNAQRRPYCEHAQHKRDFFSVTSTYLNSQLRSPPSKYEKPE